nr:immunoglobulin light chain junction region [Macaca mulatta]MOX51724.1 immunoglobulin light chain junction region [Macaca mulatta]MOX51839.1 immunoglobulin light chain junction region [Macaca mulatta]MOX51906.1 immunoglobulin light chain junction region [Macaca mulatta]MOX52035.1 immunoglobulin light chain junction region [Macaca mulatta]
CLQSKSSPWTF